MPHAAEKRRDPARVLRVPNTPGTASPSGPLGNAPADDRFCFATLVERCIQRPLISAPTDGVDGPVRRPYFGGWQLTLQPADRLIGFDRIGAVAFKTLEHARTFAAGRQRQNQAGRRNRALASVPNIDMPRLDSSSRRGGRNLDSKIAAPLDQGFGEVITYESDLRKIVGPANRWFTSKILNSLDRRCQNFIAASPFVVVSSTDPFGLVDLSPKGDRAGFVRCLDDATLAIPDRRGNRRVDTFHNVLQNPGIGLIFFVPGQRETLRVTGRAIIVRDHQERDGGPWPDTRSRDDRRR